MNQIANNKGFTLIEMLIVLALMAMLIALSAPFVTSLRSDIAMQRTLRQVKTDMVSTIDYSLAGKSFAALSADDLMNPELIPAAYSLYFETSDTYGDQAPYKYLELSADEEGLSKSMSLSYEYEHEYEAPAVYLKEIVLKNSVNSGSTTTDSAHIIILPPFGKILFVNDDETLLLHPMEGDLYQNQNDFDEIELHFQHKDDESSETILTLDKGKVINIL